MKKLLFILYLLIPVISVAQNTEHYKIYDVKQQKIITLNELASGLSGIDVLFFGEEHNDSIGHQLELNLFKAMHSNYPKVALTTEMFHTDVQLVLNEYLKGYISEKNFIKDARAWNNYKDYKPLIEYARANDLNVVAGNAATRYSNLVTKSGLSGLDALPKTSKRLLPPLPIDTATGNYYNKFIETLGGHNMGGMKIYQTQNLWDATMAWSIATYMKANKGSKILQLNGRFHSDEKLGTYQQLKTMAPKLKTANLSCFSAADFKDPKWEGYKHLGDYVIITDPGIKRTF
ncbi:ChaN family lipoprotein [Pedobacter metabolipauper]|uniref:Putative iron-regulated protein n=1 Tax=Pedobacter metabolipauper TaxID=425513 RepID=A0A4R6SQF4_9SPHI|nr:ChaN family lipoprotein [Pedobacter metabolipauper]TDQ06464.1 putative iron-regulated protein [Pedobacter metabolipauper]